MATHIGHNFSGTAGGGSAEIEVQQAGFDAGHAVILLDEKGRAGKHIEGLWDNMSMEISCKMVFQMESRKDCFMLPPNQDVL